MGSQTRERHQLDVRGEVCPFPQTRTMQKVRELTAGEQLDVVLDYPPSLKTIPRWAEQAGHLVVKVEELNG